MVIHKDNKNVKLSGHLTNIGGYFFRDVQKVELLPFVFDFVDVLVNKNPLEVARIFKEAKQQYYFF
jgi:hypothetical protein